MAVYYNEFDPYAAEWLKRLISAGRLPGGEVDNRSITEVKIDDVKGFRQAHFFAGIGGWPLALQLAGWDDRPVWTGSCPCQPFSAAGNKKGAEDERHLWPEWFRLIRESGVPTIFGEQVAGAITHGWWDDVAADLEKEKYTCAAAVLPACSVGAPHRRDRLWFVAHAQGGGKWRGQSNLHEADGRSHGECLQQLDGSGQGTLAYAYGAERWPEAEGRFDDVHRADAGGEKTASRSELHGIGDVADSEGLGWGEGRTEQPEQCGGSDAAGASCPGDPTIWLECPDGKARPVESGIRLLVNGFPNRVAALKAGGNAIVPQVAAEFIKAYMEIESC